MKKFRLAAALAAMLVIGVPLAGAQSTTSLRATMNGANETPEKGDPDGRGQATVRIKGRQVCWSVSFTKIASPAAGHIHKGAKGKAGGVTVALFTKAGKKSGCVNTTTAIANAIKKSPGSYYVNLHNATYPAGAIRGQLRK